MSDTEAIGKFGRLEDLDSESTVETFFIDRLLVDLGYSDAQIKPKKSIDELKISLGRKSVKWRPDYALTYRGRVRWICEAKGVEEELDDWVTQCQSYCLALNAAQPDNPVKYFMLSNGVATRVYHWDSDEPILDMRYHEFADGSPQYASLRELLAPSAFRQNLDTNATPSGDHLLKRHTVGELNSDFAWAHRLIYKSDNLSYNAAFMEFVKVIFLKLHSDRQAHMADGIRDLGDGTVAVPRESVKFSTAWIKSREADTPNPLDSILFQNLLSEFEILITQEKKRRIFPKGERLQLSPETLRLIVARLEHVDLISIDADLNGRMFETFLNSTLRGKGLGQFFTPRSVVKLATGLAQLRADSEHVDRVIDACSGTGGFLIEALADMWGKIDGNASLSDKRKEELRTKVAERSLYGVDVARDPALARIARINMYLHGDGGTSIFQLDALDKDVTFHTADDEEARKEKVFFKELVARATSTPRDEDGKVIPGAPPVGVADVALTNPPFAKEYKRENGVEKQILDQYELSYDSKGGKRRELASLSSMVMFLERYYDLLPGGGRLISVVDDSILGSPKNSRVRSWIRDKWIVRAVVSLPGDAFQRSQARVKTSILILEKKKDLQESQPAVFMYYCSWVGVDDPARARVLPGDEAARENARKEIREVTALYKKFREGHPDAAPWTVPADAIEERMDVKACLPERRASVPTWEGANFDVSPVSALLTLTATDSADPEARLIDTGQSDEIVTYLRVRYDGFCEAGDEVACSDVASQTFTRVHAGDIVISHINAIHGAVAIVPPECDGFVVTSEFTVCRSTGLLEPEVVWSLLRSPEARAEMLLLSTGIGRTRVRWEELSALVLPIPGIDVRQRVTRAVQEARLAEARMTELRRQAASVTASEMLLDSPRAQQIISAFKPPR